MPKKRIIPATEKEKNRDKSKKSYERKKAEIQQIKKELRTEFNEIIESMKKETQKRIEIGIQKNRSPKGIIDEIVRRGIQIVGVKGYSERKETAFKTYLRSLLEEEIQKRKTTTEKKPKTNTKEKQRTQLIKMSKKINGKNYLTANQIRKAIGTLSISSINLKIRLAKLKPTILTYDTRNKKIVLLYKKFGVTGQRRKLQIYELEEVLKKMFK